MNRSRQTAVRDTGKAPPPGKRRGVALLASIVLLGPCLSYAVLGDAPLVPLLAALLLAGAVILPRPIPDSTRAVAYTVTLAFLGTVILNQLYKVDGDRFFMPLPTELVLPLLIGMGIGFTYMVQNSRTLTATIVFAFMCFLLQGTTMVNATHNQRLPLTHPLLINRYGIFGLALLVTLLAALPLLMAALPDRQRPARVDPASGQRTLRYRRLAWLVGAIVAALGLTVLGAVTYPTTFELLSRWTNPYLNNFVRTQTSPGLFGDDVMLNQTFQYKNLDQQHKIVFRIESETAPGYLRGRTFATYETGQWRAEPPREAATRLDVDPDLAISRFQLAPGPSRYSALPAQRMEIYPTPNYRTDVLFAPADTRVVDVVASNLLTSDRGVASPRDWDQQAGYTLYADRFTQDGAWPGPTGERLDREALLYVPEELHATLDTLLARIFSGPRQSATEESRQIATFLENFASYELGLDFGYRRDPVLQFLEFYRRGHCELFATAAVMLMRRRGIPSRYVTGFYTTEPHLSGDGYVARLGHAHAWAESLDEAAGTWLLVEATPPSGLPTNYANEGWIDRFIERLHLRWAAIYAALKRGYFADGVMAILREVGRGLHWLFWGGPWLVGWGLLALAVWLGLRYRQRRRRPAIPLPCHIQHLHDSLARIEEALRQRDIVRPPTASVADLMQSVRRQAPALAAELTPLLADYQALRFQPEPAAEDAIQHFRRRVDDWLSRLPVSTPAAASELSP